MLKKAVIYIVKFVIVLCVLVVASLLIFDRLVQFRMDDNELRQYFAQHHRQVNIGHYNNRGRNLRYAYTGNNTGATLLFIHGAPGSLSYFRDYLTDSTLQQQATMFGVDRPGYGYSGLADPLPYIQQQAAAIKPVVDSLHKAHHPIILVAASYGTAIACRLVMDNPQLFDGLVLIAPALAPGQEKVLWFSKYLETPLIHWVVPRMMQSANTEKLHHKKELQKMLPLWKNIHVPVIYIQGSNDGLVYTTNATFAKQQLVNAPSVEINMIKGRGHLLAFSERKFITEKIVKMIAIAKQNARP